MIDYNIDISKDDYNKNTLPKELEDSVVIFKKNLVERESTAWEIAKNLIDFKSEKEKFIFLRDRILSFFHYFSHILFYGYQIIRKSSKKER